MGSYYSSWSLSLVSLQLDLAAAVIYRENVFLYNNGYNYSERNFLNVQLVTIVLINSYICEYELNSFYTLQKWTFWLRKPFREWYIDNIIHHICKKHFINVLSNNKRSVIRTQLTHHAKNNLHTLKPFNGRNSSIKPRSEASLVNSDSHLLISLISSSPAKPTPTYVHTFVHFISRHFPWGSVIPIFTVFLMISPLQIWQKILLQSMTFSIYCRRQWWRGRSS